MATSRRTFLEITVGATALTMVRSLADAVVLSEQTATSAPAVPAVVRIHAAQIRPKTSRLRLDKDSYAVLRNQVLHRDGWRCQSLARCRTLRFITNSFGAGRVPIRSEI